MLEHAYDRCRANKGAPGVDGQTFDDIEAAGVGNSGWGTGAGAEGKIRPQPAAIKRVWIPSRMGKVRPLGPEPSGSSVQTAVMIVLDPIFEADLQPNSMPTEQNAGRTMPSAVKGHRVVQPVSRKWWMRICPPISTIFPTAN